MNEEPMFLEMREKALRHSASARLVMLAEGRVVTGIPTAIEGFAERSNAIIEELAGQLPDTDPLKASVTGLRFDPPSEEPLTSRFFSLRDATVKEGVIEVELGLIRIDLSKVPRGASSLRPPTPRERSNPRTLQPLAILPRRHDHDG